MVDATAAATALALANVLSVNDTLLQVLVLRNNNLTSEGVMALCEALRESNADESRSVEQSHRFRCRIEYRRNAESESFHSSTQFEYVDSLCLYYMSVIFKFKDNSFPLEFASYIDRNLRIQWTHVHAVLLDICIAMSVLRLPPYVMLWIIDWVPHYDLVSHRRKIF